MTLETVNAGPTKRFFVEMLTRDIELNDAILDLLDNCIDGVLRTIGNQGSEGERPYEGFQAEIKADPDGFEIRDNCGGIPKDIAINSAFMFGRPDERDHELKTIGMYGIGMKRAIFKMGRSAVVESQHQEVAYKVEIPRDWFTSEEWPLQLEDVDPQEGDGGTVVRVQDLVPGVATEFDEDGSFLSTLGREIGELFSLIINKGFQVSLNGEIIRPAELGILSPDSLEDAGKVRPYLFTGTVEGVEVRLAAGFFRKLGSLEESEREEVEPQEHLSRAGWTVVCNDRVVLHADRTRVTGWGRNRVPAYHPQFRAFAGLVVFESTDSIRLPLTTTKRGLDASSSVYLAVLEFMQQATRTFTQFTNRWKSKEKEANAALSGTSRKSVDELVASAAAEDWTTSRKHDARYFRPTLPEPDGSRPRMARIVFSRPLDDVQAVAEDLLGDSEAPPQQVGEAAFDRALMRARGES